MLRLSHCRNLSRCGGIILLPPHVGARMQHRNAGGVLVPYITRKLAARMAQEPITQSLTAFLRQQEPNYISYNQIIIVFLQ
jgi:hypothetical protein